MHPVVRLEWRWSLCGFAEWSLHAIIGLLQKVRIASVTKTSTCILSNGNFPKYPSSKFFKLFTGFMTSSPLRTYPGWGVSCRIVLLEFTSEKEEKILRMTIWPRCTRWDVNTVYECLASESKQKDSENYPNVYRNWCKRQHPWENVLHDLDKTVA